MKRSTIIGFVILLIAIVGLMGIILYSGYRKSLVKPEGRQAKPEIVTEECYYIKDTDGYVTVYLSDEKTVYEYSSIPTNMLSQEIRQQLKFGIKVKTIGEVYGFLENYSS